MKLQRYHQTEEKSWMRIGIEALLPLIAGKVIDKDIPIQFNNTAQWCIAGFLLKPFISMLSCIDMEDIVIRTNNALLYKEDAFQNVDVHTHFTKDKTSLTQVFVEFLKFFGTIVAVVYTINNPKGNTGQNISLVSLSLDVVNKLFISNTTKINYISSFLPYYYKGDEYIGYFSSHIEWIGEADEDGYCECVIKDSLGNTYEDIYC